MLRGEKKILAKVPNLRKGSTYTAAMPLTSSR